MLLAGLALGGAVAFRFHLAPAVAIAVAMGCRLEGRERWVPVLAGALSPVLFLALLDWATWGVPLASVLNNFIGNVVADRASSYGVDPANWYLAAIVDRYGALLVLLAPFALVGSVRAPILLATAVVVVASHSLVPHKEYRFIYPAMLCLTALAGLGFGTCATLLRRQFRVEAVEATALPVAIGVMVVATLVASLAPTAQRRMFLRHNALNAFAALHGDPDVCGIAYADGRVYEYPGYSGLHRRVPFYLLSSLQAAHAENAANVIVAQIRSPAPASPPAGTRCFDDGTPAAVCIVKRAGPCTPAPSLELTSDPRWSGHWR
jgi:hypothetical protein